MRHALLRGPQLALREWPHVRYMKRATSRALRSDPARSIKDAITGRVVALFVFFCPPPRGGNISVQVESISF
jgi:hypothetical protein